MTEDPAIIRLNIEHYRELLKLYSTPQTQKQLMNLLAEAQSALSKAEAAEQKR
jgi:uncharacterized protein (DUF1778 family)